MKRLLLTGAAGFVGHHTLAHLLKTTNWDIVVTDSFRHFGTSARLRAVFEELPQHRNRVKVVTHDLNSPIDHVTANEIGNVNFIINILTGNIPAPELTSKNVSLYRINHMADFYYFLL